MNWQSIYEIITNTWFISVCSSIIAYILIRWAGIIFFDYLPIGMKRLARLYFTVKKRDDEFIESFIQFFRKGENQCAIAVFFATHLAVLLFLLSMFVLSTIMTIGSHLDEATKTEKWIIDIMQIFATVGMLMYGRMFAMFYNFFWSEFNKEKIN